MVVKVPGSDHELRGRMERPPFVFPSDNLNSGYIKSLQRKESYSSENPIDELFRGWEESQIPSLERH